VNYNNVRSTPSTTPKGWISRCSMRLLSTVTCTHSESVLEEFSTREGDMVGSGSCRVDESESVSDDEEVRK
jgi:hypothetical protein